MGRNKAAFTGHTELRTSFTRKGAVVKDIRLIINYNQVEHKESYGYIYQIHYDGQVFYQTFKERYYQNNEGATIVNYPGDDAFVENKYQWAWTTNTLEEAKEILETFECNL